MTESNLYERIIEEENALMDRCHSRFIRTFPKSKVMHTCRTACEDCNLKVDDRCTRVYDRVVEKAYYDSTRNLEKTVPRKKLEGESLAKLNEDLLNFTYSAAQLNATQLKTLEIKINYITIHSFLCPEEHERTLERIRNQSAEDNRSLTERLKCEHVDWPDKQRVDNISYCRIIMWLNAQMDRIASTTKEKNKRCFDKARYDFTRNAEQFDIYQIEVLENKLQYIRETDHKYEIEASHKRALRNKAKVEKMFKMKYESK